MSAEIFIWGVYSFQRFSLYWVETPLSRWGWGQPTYCRGWGGSGALLLLIQVLTNPPISSFSRSAWWLHQDLHHFKRPLFRPLFPSTSFRFYLIELMKFGLRLLCAVFISLVVEIHKTKQLLLFPKELICQEMIWEMIDFSNHIVINFLFYMQVRRFPGKLKIKEFYILEFQSSIYDALKTGTRHSTKALLDCAS